MKIKDAGRSVAVRGVEDEREVIKAANLSADYVIIHCLDWKVIPLENLIANTRGKSKLLAEVSSLEEAKLALETLELGADGVVLKTSDSDELMKAAYLVKKQIPRIKLVPVKIVEVKQIGIGARVCVDTCDLMKEGKVSFLGASPHAYFWWRRKSTKTPSFNPDPLG